MRNRIKQLREESGMTQVRLSIELEVTQETVSAYEIGKLYPSVKSLLKMADLFNASIDYILGLSDIKKAASTEILSHDETRIIALYRKMNKMQKEKVYAFMQGQTS
ncbi:hypothetical protein SDC9_117642 [bioreactor metagenome]|uniref:HTH cro/C1-type domain-containing protein n=1 Tax=bioreactor metagenome TaxID=1076179 RepID=A0A645BZK0_9ZZZZ